MATASNTSAVQSNQTPLAGVGQDCTHVSLWDSETGGNGLDWAAISTDPDALQLGERLQIAAGALVITQPQGTNESGAYAVRGVNGKIAGGVWVQWHTASPGSNFTANVIPGLTRTALAAAAFTVAE